MKRFREFIEEEVPANSAGTGNIAGLTGDPPVSRKAQMRHTQQNKEQGKRRTFIIDMLRRSFPNMVGTK